MGESDDELRKRVFGELRDYMHVHLVSINNVFADWDDGDGLITLPELRAGLDSVGIKLTRQESRRVYKAIDRDNSGNIDLDEMTRAVKDETYFEEQHGRVNAQREEAAFRKRLEKRHAKDQGPALEVLGRVAPHVRELLSTNGEHIRDLYISLDEQRDGYISYDEVTRWAKTLALGLTREECGLLFHAIDRDGSGVIEFREFEYRLMRTGISTDHNMPKRHVLRRPRTLSPLSNLRAKRDAALEGLQRALRQNLSGQFDTSYYEKRLARLNLQLAVKVKQMQEEGLQKQSDYIALRLAPRVRGRAKTAPGSASRPRGGGAAAAAGLLADRPVVRAGVRPMTAPGRKAGGTRRKPNAERRARAASDADRLEDEQRRQNDDNQIRLHNVWVAEQDRLFREELERRLGETDFLSMPAPALVPSNSELAIPGSMNSLGMNRPLPRKMKKHRSATSLKRGAAGARPASAPASEAQQQQQQQSDLASGGAFFADCEAVRLGRALDDFAGLGTAGGADPQHAADSLQRIPTKPYLGSVQRMREEASTNFNPAETEDLGVSTQSPAMRKVDDFAFGSVAEEEQ